MRFGRACVWVVGVAGLLLLPGAARAGSALEGPKAAGMAGAFAAVADDPSAIAHNPAGLTILRGTNLYGGTAVVNLSSEYESPEGRSETTPFRLYFPPNAFLSSDFGLKDLAFGMGIYSPFGIGGRNWSETGPTRFASTQGLIATINANPTVAWRVLPQLSLGAGLDILYSSNYMAKMVDQSALDFRDAKLTFKGDGIGVGGNFGMLLFPQGTVSLAFAYRSEVRLRQRGTLDLGFIAPPLQPILGGGVFRSDASMVMEFPHIFAWGVACRPTSQVTLSLEVDWLWWSVLSQTVLNLRTQIPAAGLTKIPLLFDWKDSLVIMTGVDYKLSERLSLRGGYVYQQATVPASTLNPGDPDSEQHYLTVGLGYSPGHWVLDGFYAIGFYMDRTVNNTILSGNYRSLTNLGGVNLGYHF